MRCRVCFPAGAGAGAVARKRAAGIGARMHDASRSLSLMSERETSDTSLSRFFSVRPTARVLPASECVCLVPRSFLLDGLSLTVRSEKSHLFHYEKGTKQRKVSLYPFPFFSSSGAAHLYTAISKLYGTATPSCDAWRHASVVAGAVGAATVPASPSTSGARPVEQAPRSATARPRCAALVRSRKQRAVGGCCGLSTSSHQVKLLY
jgi:hypothetical protein